MITQARGTKYLNCRHISHSCENVRRSFYINNCFESLPNKYAVNCVLKRSNLPNIPSVEITSRSQLLDKKNKIESMGYPIIAKPSENTAAMSGFRILTNFTELSKYLDNHLGAKNTYYKDKVIEKILVQKCIPISKFNEYVIDFVSFAGKHYCTGILKYVKSTDGSYRKYVAIPLEEIPAIKPVLDYVESCLNALKVEYGITHNEVFWNMQDKCYLIESNNRPAGNSILDIYQNTYGYNTLSLYLDLLENKSTSKYPLKRKSYSLVLDIFNKYLENPSNINMDDISSFKKLVHFRGKRQKPTSTKESYTRADTVTAAVLLDNCSQELLNKDIQCILQREESGNLFLP